MSRDTQERPRGPTHPLRNSALIASDSASAETRPVVASVANAAAGPDGAANHEAIVSAVASVIS